jgi:hypothetical protein
MWFIFTSDQRATQLSYGLTGKADFYPDTLLYAAW